MKRESIKALLLFFLVALSITLTWSIWSYQGNYAPTNSSEPTKINNIASSYQLSEVVKPYQVIRYDSDNQKALKGVFGNSVTPIYNLLINAKLNPQPALPVHFPKAEGHVYELIYPTPISSTIIKDLFNFSTSSGSSISQDWLVSGIRIFRTDTKTDNAYIVFQDQSGQPMFYAKGELTGLTKFDEASKDTTNWLDYTVLHLKDHELYLPNEPIKTVTSESHLYSLIGFDMYKPILFNDPRQVVFSGNSYSDGVSQLVNRQRLVMQYYNTVSNGSGAYDPILQSYQFINNHKGWTNQFNIDDYTAIPAKGQGQVSFRLTENGLPVFSMEAYPYEYESEILMVWNSGELSKLDRTLVNIGVSYKQANQKVMTTPLENIDLLKKTGAFKIESLTDFRLGYEMNLNQKEQSVTLTPSWFFKQDGAWISVTDFLNSHSNELQGMRGGGT